MKFRIPFYLLCLLLWAFPTFSANSPTFYTVEPGDTWYSLGRKTSVSPQILAEWNKRNLTDPLKVGEILKLSQDKEREVPQPSGKSYAEPVVPEKKPIRPSHPLPFPEKIAKPFQDSTLEPHKGVEYQKQKSEYTQAVLPGKVVSIDYMDGYKNYVILEHEDGFHTVYGNLERVFVTEGQKVRDREKLGSLTREKGLYFQVNKGKLPVSPQSFLSKDF